MSELKTTIKTLTDFNIWRRGDDEDMQQPAPRDIGLAIDHAVHVLREVENLIASTH